MKVNPQPLWIVLTKAGKVDRAYAKYDSARGRSREINGIVEPVLLYGYKELTFAGLNSKPTAEREKPVFSHHARNVRNLFILKAVLEGDSLATVGNSYGISPQGINRIVLKLCEVARKRLKFNDWETSILYYRENKEFIFKSLEITA